MHICLFVRVKDPHANPWLKRFDFEALLSRSVYIYIYVYVRIFDSVYIYMCDNQISTHALESVSFRRETFVSHSRVSDTLIQEREKIEKCLSLVVE